MWEQDSSGLWKAQTAQGTLTARLLRTHTDPQSWQQYSSFFAYHEPAEDIINEVDAEFVYRPWLQGFETLFHGDTLQLHQQLPLLAKLDYDDPAKEHLARARLAVEAYANSLR